MAVESDCQSITQTLIPLSRQILEIDEVTTGASLSTATSPTAESTKPLNPRKFALTGDLKGALDASKAREFFPDEQRNGNSLKFSRDRRRCRDGKCSAVVAPVYERSSIREE
ncbi:hypothetical protein EJB05_12906, partial [Eragrostis curvula]